MAAPDRAGGVNLSISTDRPEQVFQGPLLLTVPHMDDCVLACGGTIAQLPHKDRIHVVYATDGKGSPAPVLSRRDAVPPNLDQIRMNEARCALRHLGVPQSNIHFLALPDGRLNDFADELGHRLEELTRAIGPRLVLTPFRYDRHSDHLALNRVVTQAWQMGSWGEISLFEYFVYYRWRLLPGGDLRRYLRPDLLVEVDISLVSKLKREALELFHSQTKLLFEWQTRPTLTPALLDEVSRCSEVFLRSDRSIPGAKVFRRGVGWIHVANRIEPVLKRMKDRTIALLKRGLTTDG